MNKSDEYFRQLDREFGEKEDRRLRLADLSRRSIEMSLPEDEPEDPHGECAAEIHRLEADLERLRNACLQEHGGKHHEPQCVICEALALSAGQKP